MREIIFEGDPGTEIYFDEIDKANMPIFAKREGKLRGMIVHEEKQKGRLHYGWILRTGGSYGSYGYRGSLGICIEAGIELGFTFFVE